MKGPSSEVLKVFSRGGLRWGLPGHAHLFPSGGTDFDSGRGYVQGVSPGTGTKNQVLRWPRRGRRVCGDGSTQGRRTQGSRSPLKDLLIGPTTLRG